MIMIMKEAPSSPIEDVMRNVICLFRKVIKII